MTEIFSQNDVSRILKRAADISLEKLALSTRLENFINSHGYFSNYDVKFSL